MSTITPAPANGQPGAADPPLDPVLAKAKQEAEARKAIAEADKATADARKAELAASLPTSDVQPLEGKTELGDKVGLIADLIAHAQLSRGAAAIGADVDGKLANATRVLLVEDRDLLDIDWPRQLLTLQLTHHSGLLTQMKNALEGALNGDSIIEIQEEPEAGGDGESGDIEIEGEAANVLKATMGPRFAMPGLDPISIGLSTASAGVGMAAQIAGMFRANYSIKSRDVSVGTVSLLAAVGHELNGRGRSVEVEGFDRLEETTVVQSFADALKERIELASLKARVSTEVVEPAKKKVERLTASLKEASTKVTEATATGGEALERANTRETSLSEQLERAEATAAKGGLVASADALISAFDTFGTTALAAPTADKPVYPPLLAAALGERLHGGEHKFSHVLYVGLESAAGESITRQFLWLSGKVRYIGGLQVAWMLLDLGENTVTASGAEPFAAQIKFDLNRGVTEQAAPVYLTTPSPLSFTADSGGGPPRDVQNPPPPPQVPAAEVEGSVASV